VRKIIESTFVPLDGVVGDPRSSAPYWRSEVHLLVAERDYVVERFTASGKHRGEFRGAAPTNRTVAMPGINIFRLRDGKIVERWGNFDVLGFLVQLGVIPAPAEA
jgi:predicted ester cyclase